MNIGQLLGGAGVVGRGMREGAEAERIAQQNQLNIEEQNRAADLKQQIAGLQMQSFQPVNVPQFTQQFTPGQMMPMGAAPAAPAAPAPAALVPAPAAPAAGSGLGGVRRMTPEEVTRLQQDPYATGQVTLTPASDLPSAIENLGVQFDAAKMAHLQAVETLQRFGSVQRQQNPAGYQAAVAAEARAQQARKTAQQSYETAAVPFTTPVQLGGTRLMQPAAAPAAPAPAEAPKLNKTALSYDNRVTPYDAIIQQSAAQYGIDPVVFKRLLGTESSFNPTAVSPRGEKFGLGIAQIAAVHGLSREQMLDPNVAIPAGAQIFAKMLGQAGGNYELALQRYKGASSEKGKAAMAGPIGIILSGLTPAATPAGAAPGVAPAPGAAPMALEVPQTQARNMQMAEYYLANFESIPYELQQVNQMAQQQAAFLTQQRNETAQLAQMNMRSGTQQGIAAAMRLRENIGQLDSSLLQIQQQVGQKQAYLQGMQGLRELALANDPRRLAGVLTQFMGAPVGIQPRPDGKYNLFVNGTKVQDGLTSEQLANNALKQFSPEARTASAESAKLENELALKRKYGDAMVNAMRDIQKAIIDGEYKIADERAKQQGGKLTIDTSKGVAYFQKGDRVFVINPDGKVEETPFGTIELPSVARPVVGLNIGR